MKNFFRKPMFTAYQVFIIWGIGALIAWKAPVWICWVVLFLLFTSPRAK